MAVLLEVVMHPPGEQKHEPRLKPSREEVLNALAVLRRDWAVIVGADIGAVTYPLVFTGKKRRRLVILALESHQPPWATWWSLKPYIKKWNSPDFAGPSMMQLHP